MFGESFINIFKGAFAGGIESPNYIESAVGNFECSGNENSISSCNYAINLRLDSVLQEG